MTRLNRSRSTMIDQLLQFAADHPEIIAANPRAAALIAQLPAIAQLLRTLGRNQSSGQRLYRSGAQERATIAAALRKALRKIHKVAQVLDPAEHPGIRPKFKMPIDSYRALADTGRAFLEHATPIASVFIERGRPPTSLASSPPSSPAWKPPPSTNTTAASNKWPAPPASKPKPAAA